MGKTCLENSADSHLCFWLALLQSLSYFFSSINHLPHLCAQFLILFQLTLMRFSQSTHLLVFLSLETLMFIIRTGLPILVELIDLVNSVIIFLSQMTLLRWLTFLLGSQTVILTVLLFWIYLFLLTLVFVLQWLSLYWEILSYCCLIFHWLSIKFTTGCPISSLSLWLFGWSSWSFERCPMVGYL